MAAETAVIGQSGGPTAVINQSLVGVIEGLQEAFKPRAAGGGGTLRILGMRHGVRGLVAGDLVELGGISRERLDAIADTPSAALGSTRDKPDKAYCEKIAQASKDAGARYFFYIGGNDSSDTARIVSEFARNARYDLRCFHVPKTVDNDLMENDHTPGFPSAARYVATAFLADSLDNISLPGIKINVVMGRHAGFLTAASALARAPLNGSPSGRATGPHLIYLPEVPFDTGRFVEEVRGVYARLGRCQVAVSEGIMDASGTPIGASLIAGEKDAHGNVQLSGSGALGDQLADLIKKRITDAKGKPARVRADTLGYLQRCWPDASAVDKSEAREAGRQAALAAAEGVTSTSIAIKRTSTQGEAYMSECARVPLEAIAAKTRHVPNEFISGTSDVSRAFIEYCAPLVGRLPEVAGV